MINEKRSNGVFSLIQIDVENIDHTFSRFNRIYRVVMQRWMRFIWNSIGWNTAPHAKFSSFFSYQKNTIAPWLIRITREKVLAERQWLTNASSENKNTVVLFAIAFTIQSHVRLGFFFWSFSSIYVRIEKTAIFIYELTQYSANFLLLQF